MKKSLIISDLENQRRFVNNIIANPTRKWKVEAKFLGLPLPSLPGAVFAATDPSILKKINK